MTDLIADARALLDLLADHALSLTDADSAALFQPQSGEYASAARSRGWVTRAAHGIRQ